MEWQQQFHILHTVIMQKLAGQGIKPSLKNAAEYLGVPVHKYQAWKDGQSPVTEDLRRLALEFGFGADWLLLGIGEPMATGPTHPMVLQHDEGAVENWQERVDRLQQQFIKAQSDLIEQQKVNFKLAEEFRAWQSSVQEEEFAASPKNVRCSETVQD